MKERISSFIIACALVFSCVAIPFLTRPVPAYASATPFVPTGNPAVDAWEAMMHLWALEGLFTHDSANYYGGFQGYTDEQKSNAMSGLKDFFDGQTRDLKNWLVVGKGIAEAKVNDWWDNLKSGTLDLVGDVGSAVYDWLNSKSGDVAKQWETSSNGDYSNYFNADGMISGSSFLGYLKSTALCFDEDRIQNSYYGFMYLGSTTIYAITYCGNHLSGQFWKLQRNVENNLYWTFRVYGDLTFAQLNDYVNAGNGALLSDIVLNHVKDKTNIKLPPTAEDLENQRQLPAVIDTYGGNLPKPYRDPNNDDDGDGKDKPVPYVPQPIHIDWPKIHGDGDGSGGVKIIIKDTDINSTKQFNYNEYKKLQVQITKLSQTLNKILNLKQYNIQNNTEIGGKGKVLPFIQPDFHQAIDFKKKFPFSLPWDVLYIFKLFNSTPEAPAVTIDYPVISKGSGWGGYTVTTKPIVVDFNTDIWNKVAKVCRVMLFLLFAVGVCWAFFVK